MTVSGRGLSVLFFAAGGLLAQDVAGDWIGTLQAGPAEIRIAFHIAKAADGALSGTMDSPDQTTTGLAFDTVSLADGGLNLVSGAMGVSYEGKLSADAKTISGTWTQGRMVPLDLRRGTWKTTHAPAPPSDVDGTWTGVVDTGRGTLKINLHLVNTADGLTATLDAPQQGAAGVPATGVSREGSALRVELRQIPVTFSGTIAADRMSIAGTWSQNGSTFPLTLKLAK